VKLLSGLLEVAVPVEDEGSLLGKGEEGEKGEATGNGKAGGKEESRDPLRRRTIATT
jgi:hypothetical protein